MADRIEKVKARLPRGFIDRSPEDIRAVEKMMAAIRGVYELYGFEPADQPMIEYTDALGKFLPDQDRPNEGVFSFQDDDEQWMSLRYDLTAPLARYVAENFERLPKPYRSYRAGWVFRNEKPGPGRFRQFMQFDADTVGTPGVAADAEMCMMMADVMEAVGIKRGKYVIRVNNRKVLDGWRHAMGFGDATHDPKWLTVMRALDKFDRLGREGVELLLGRGRKDESGDFTPGAGLGAAEIVRLAQMLTLRMDVDSLAQGKGVNPIVNFGLDADTLTQKSLTQTIQSIASHYVANERVGGGTIDVLAHALQELDSISDIIAACGYDDGRIRIDPSVVRGLEYYTGPVYEAELLAEIPNEDGQIVRFGSVGGGGRYDGLVSRFRGEPVPATGFSIGVSRLMTALKNLGKLGTSDVLAPVVVLVMDKDVDSLGRYQKMVAKLRQAGIRAEMYLGGAGMKAQMKYADRRGAPCVVIQGGDERNAVDENGEPKLMVQIKDLIEGKRLSEEIADNLAWRESRPAQVTVEEDDLVAAVRKILDGQAEDRAKGGSA